MQLIPKSTCISNIIIIRQLEVLIFYFRSPCAFKMSYGKGQYFKKPLKMLKKHIFQQKSSCDIFKSMLDMDLMFFGGRKTSHGLTLKRLSDPQPTQRQKPPHI